jgi:hypothetical protein
MSLPLVGSIAEGGPLFSLAIIDFFAMWGRFSFLLPQKLSGGCPLRYWGGALARGYKPGSE